MRIANGNIEQLDAFIERHERYFADLPDYKDHLAWLIARYSRGDDVADLAAAFPIVVDKVVESDALNRSRHQTGAPYFTHQGRYAGLFRDALVLLSLARCLRQPEEMTRRLLACCERGDPLIETVAGAALPAGTPAPAFPQFFEELYAALQASPARRPESIAAYLSAWPERFTGFGFLVAHEKIGYWCIEAAGVVAALGIDDRTFARDIHYPEDLVRFARGA